MSRPGRWTFLVFVLRAQAIPGRDHSVDLAAFTTQPERGRVFFGLFFDTVLSKICLTSYGDQFNTTLSLSLNWQF